MEGLQLELTSSAEQRTTSGPDTPADSPADALATPLVVRANASRRQVKLGNAGMTPKDVRVVEMTPLAERRKTTHYTKSESETFDAGFPDVPKQGGGGGGGGGGRKGKNRRRNKKKKR